jgi:hypothetical protein
VEIKIWLSQIYHVFLYSILTKGENIMKKTGLLILLLAPAALLAQPTLTYQSHGLREGDNHGMQKVAYVSPGQAGTDQTWDYSELSPIDAARNESIAKGAPGKVQVTSADGSLFTYTCNKKANVYEGYVSTGRTVEFEIPITKTTYPFTYGSHLSGPFNGHCYYGANQSLAGTMFGTYSSEGDAYGTLLLPNNVKLNNVLRVKTRESYTESLCATVNIEIVKYLWYAAEYRYPVFVTWEIAYIYENGQTSTLNESFYTTQTLVSSPEKSIIAEEPAFKAIEEKTASEPEPTPEVQYTLYPNPYNSYFHLTYTLEKEMMVNIVLYTASGQYITHLVKDKRQNGTQHITYNPQSVDFAGLYVIRMLFDDKVYIKTLVKE